MNIFACATFQDLLIYLGLMLGLAVAIMFVIITVITSVFRLVRWR